MSVGRPTNSTCGSDQTRRRCLADRKQMARKMCGGSHSSLLHCLKKVLFFAHDLSMIHKAAVAGSIPARGRVGRGPVAWS
ncbi:hypothetical protein [Pandoravirus japonicus]|uniref:Uncharacterized protein n=1 Tax=Pandoravirus japonicus TaxID=2823154 RepID=A0A811BPM2_9VIRU|nr:hypothetical protein [Pandoravirus japonicus]